MSEEATPTTDNTPAPETGNDQENPLAFNINEPLPAEGAEGNAGGGEAAPIPDAEEYALEIDPKHGMPEDTKAFMTAQAKALGIPAKAMSDFLNNAIADLDKKQKAMNIAAVDALKKEWGEEFEKRSISTQNFVRRISKPAGLTEEDAKLLFTPAGYRIMYGISKLFSERKDISGKPGEATMTKEQRRAMAEDMRTNPKNENYKLFHDPSVPRSSRLPAWRRYNELVGREIYPEK